MYASNKQHISSCPHTHTLTHKRPIDTYKLSLFTTSVFTTSVFTTSVFTTSTHKRPIDTYKLSR